MYLRAGSCVLVRRFRLRCPSPHKDEVATFHFSNEVWRRGLIEDMEKESRNSVSLDPASTI